MTNIKVVLLGQAFVGKSCIVNRLINNTFYENMFETIGASFAYYQTPDAKFEIWDTAGQERYAPISRMYYANADIIILVFDVTITSSWKRINELIYEIHQYNTTAKYIIVGNKIDLQPKISFNQWLHPHLKDFEKDIIYVSAKNNINIDRLKTRLSDYSKIIPKKNKTVDIIDLDETVNHKCC